MNNTGKKVNFLTEKENIIMRYLDEAQKLFDEVSLEDPQNSLDSFNFGHYVDAARGAVILRGARRIDPDALMPNREKFITKEDITCPADNVDMFGGDLRCGRCEGVDPQDGYDFEVKKRN